MSRDSGGGVGIAGLVHGRGRSGRERAGGGVVGAAGERAGAGLSARPGSVRGRGCRRGRGACGGGVVGAAGERAGAGLSARPGSVRGRGCRRGRGACGGGVVGAAGERAGAGLSARPGSVRGRGCRRGRGACGGGVVGAAGERAGAGLGRRLCRRRAVPATADGSQRATHLRVHDNPPAQPSANATNAPRERRICAGRNRGEIATGRPVPPAAIRLAVRRRRAAPSLPISDGGLRRNRSLSCQSGGGRGF